MKEQLPRKVKRSEESAKTATFLSALSMKMAKDLRRPAQQRAAVSGNRQDQGTPTVGTRLLGALSAAYGAAARVHLLEGAESPSTTSASGKSDRAHRKGLKQGFNRHFCSKCGVFKCNQTVRNEGSPSPLLMRPRHEVLHPADPADGSKDEEGKGRRSTRKFCKVCLVAAAGKRKRSCSSGGGGRRDAAASDDSQTSGAQIKGPNRRKRSARARKGVASSRKGVAGSAQKRTSCGGKIIGTATSVTSTPAGQSTTTQSKPQRVSSMSALKRSSGVAGGGGGASAAKRSSIGAPVADSPQPQGTRVVAAASQPESQAERQRKPAAVENNPAGQVHPGKASATPTAEGAPVPPRRPPPTPGKGKGPPPKGSTPKGKPSRPSSSLQGLGIF